MQDFSCSKCGSIDVYIDDRGNQKALMCKDCGAWLKWVGKKEMPLVIQYIRANKLETMKAKDIKLKSYLGEFVIITDDKGVEIVVFQSDEIKKLEESVCKLLDYLKVSYEFK